MDKKTALENLVFESGLTLKQFSDKIGLLQSTFEKQLRNQKNRHIEYAFKYGRILGVDSIKGYVYGVYYEIVLK